MNFMQNTDKETLEIPQVLMDLTGGDKQLISFSTEEHLSLHHDVDDVHKKNNDMMLNLKSANIFAADQTPTPTRLIKNCEEVGLFDDLQHVNPFEETFRRAVEQNTGHGLATSCTDVTELADEDSLHTPQVFPQMMEPSSIRGSAPVILDDGPIVGDLLATSDTSFKLTTSRQNSGSSTCSSTFGYGKIQKYRNIMEKTLQLSSTQTTSNNVVAQDNPAQFVQMPPIQLMQPQVITVSFPQNSASGACKKELPTVISGNAIPVQTVKPFILPKLSTAPSDNASSSQFTGVLTTSSVPTNGSDTLGSTEFLHEPTSSCILTQLPIKERLKAILSHNKIRNSSQSTVEIQNKSVAHRRRQRTNNTKSTLKYDEEDCIERRRAASTRYRLKMRNEHKELRRKNTELQAENVKQRQRIQQLEQELAKQQQHTLQQVLGNDAGIRAQIQIPSSTVHLVMNIPNLVVSANGQPILQNPITYRVEKK